MPQLDGVSATAMIRDMQPNTPIIAMTSNINQQDLEIYFQWVKLTQLLFEYALGWIMLIF